MNFDLFSPYIRVAMKSYINAPFTITERIIFDFEIIYIEAGKWKLTIYGKEYLCEKDSVLFIPPDTPHIIELFNNTNVSQPHIHFDVIYDKYSPSVYVSFKKKSEMSYNEKLMIRENILDLPSPILKVSDLKYFKKIFYEIIDSFQDKNPLYQLDCKEKMLSLLKYLLCENTISTFNYRNSNNIIYSIKSYIDHNYQNNITLEMLEKQFSYNKYYISRLFTKEYGTSIINYCQTLKLQQAKDYLKSGLSITKISEMLSFSSIYSFSRFFKNATGMYPTDYKQSK